MEKVYNIKEFGAVGDGEVLDTAAIQAAIDACTQQGGGKVLIPNGRYLTGTVILKTGVDFYLEPSARIVSSMNEQDFLQDPVFGRRGLICAFQSERISVTGTGIIDGQGEHFLTPDDGVGHHVLVPLVDFRPKLIDLEGCTDVLFRDVTLYRASSWCLHMTGCSRVNVHAIKILGQLRGPNNDGIDPDSCKDVHISDCHIEAGDDCIVLKTTAYGAKHYGPCENITVTNCTLISRSTALKIGTETHADIRNAVFSNCVIRYSNRGLGIWSRDGGCIENIMFSNMVIDTRLFSDEFEPKRPRRWWGKGEPIFISAERRPGGVKPGGIRNISFQHMIAEGENAVYLEGSEDCLIEDIQIRDMRLALRDKSGYPGGVFDTSPSERKVFPHETPAVFIRFARGVELQDVKVGWKGPRKPNWTHALMAIQVEELVLDNFKGTAAAEGLDSVHLQAVAKLTVSRCGELSNIQ